MYFAGHNMSVMGSQLEIDMDPDGDLTVVPRHVGNTGTGMYTFNYRLSSRSQTKYVINENESQVVITYTTIAYTTCGVARASPTRCPE